MAAGYEASTPAEALHALRIDCKKLRYLLEFFSGILGKQATARLIVGMKQLQDNLGTFNDLSVQQEKLVHFAHDMVREQQVSADALLAMGRLVEHLAARQSDQRARVRRSYEMVSSMGLRAERSSTSAYRPGEGPA